MHGKSSGDPRIAGQSKLPTKGVIGQGGGVGEGQQLPNKDCSRDPKAGKPATWKTGKNG